MAYPGRHLCRVLTQHLTAVGRGLWLHVSAYKRGRCRGVSLNVIVFRVSGMGDDFSWNEGNVVPCLPTREPKCIPRKR